MNQFFQSSRFIIVGASNEPHKFGYKVMTWYKQHKLPNIIPMNPVTSFPFLGYILIQQGLTKELDEMNDNRKEAL
jgi:predicted CoA-binding protein